ncbi:MAG: hypothetical protein HeimC2_02950 [Candidatus Heimdallarchaeota archaeon LC_2]|nr:MAG: hypothetical protein HeimC2_02950 [Candidatus Heimdallarchaeota archaeon LC_2]
MCSIMQIKLIKYVLGVILIINIAIISIVTAQNLPNSSGNLALATLPAGTSYFPSDEPLQVNQIDPNEECFVPCNQIYRGQVKDGIPSVDNPTFVNPGDENEPHPREKVIGIVVGGITRAYPFDVLNWHEIVNDVFDGVHISVTYCPLTGSGCVIPTAALGNAELGTSGFLYENNLVFYDRNTDTEFSQMGLVGIRGELSGVEVEYSPAVETTWEAWQRLHPETQVLSRETGIVRDYDRYPYGTYKSDKSIYFPSTYNDNEAPYNLYHEKTLTQILRIDDQVLLLPFPELDKNQVFNHQFNNKDLLTLYEPDEALALTYSSIVNDIALEFSSYQDSSNSLNIDLTLDLQLFIDESNTIWNFNGLAISGPLQGEQLTLIATYNAFWFAASTFHSSANILVIDGENIQFDVTPELQDTDFVSFSPFFFAGLLVLIVPVYILRRKDKL